MIDENDNSENKIDVIASKIKRSEIALEKAVKSLDQVQKKLSEDSGRLTLEVMEMGNMAAGVSEVLTQAIKKEMETILPHVTKYMVKDVQDKLNDSTTGSMEKIKSASGIAHDVIMNANTIMHQHKKELTLRRVWLGAVFFMGSLATALGIFYFFPQNINYVVDRDFMRTYFVGMVVRQNLNELSPKDRKMIEEKFKKYDN